MSDSHDELIDLGNGATLTLPASYVDYEGLSEAKEWLRTRLTFASGDSHLVTFISPVRLSQDIEEELESSAFFFEPNLIVVPDLKRGTLIGVAQAISQLGANHLRGATI